MYQTCSTKVCPLLMAASLANSDRSVQIELQERNRICCMEDSCAWWVNGACAVAGLLAGFAGSMRASA